MTNSGAPAIRHAIPVTNSSYAYSTLTIGGCVDGGSQTGVQLLRQSINNNYSSLNVTMTVAAGGSLSGANGVVIGQTGTGYGSTTASIDNSGTITGTGTGTDGTLTNSGTISNSGTGAAITGTSLTLINQAGGLISAGATAVDILDSGTLTNAGTINGNLRLGAGSDTLTVGYADGAVRTGVTGTIDGGAGMNRLRIRFTSDATLASAPVLPNGFRQMILSPDAGKTATLGGGYQSADTLRIGGNGTVISNATLSGAGTLLTDDGNSNEKPIIVNAGTIIGTPGSTNGWPASAVQLYQAQRFENSGTITAGGNAVLFTSPTIPPDRTRASPRPPPGIWNIGTVDGSRSRAAIPRARTGFRRSASAPSPPAACARYWRRRGARTAMPGWPWRNGRRCRRISPSRRPGRTSCRHPADLAELKWLCARRSFYSSPGRGGGRPKA